LPSGEDDVRGPRVRQVWRQGATAFGGFALDRPASPGPMLRHRRQGPTMQVHITSINTSVHKEGFKIDFILSSQSKLLTGCSESGYSTSHESDAGSVPRRDSARRVFMLPDRLFSLRRIFCSDSSAQPVHFHRNVHARLASASRAAFSSAILASSAATRSVASSRARARARSSVASSAISSAICSSVNPAAWAERIKRSLRTSSSP
jgi:hypothetical protein